MSRSTEANVSAKALSRKVPPGPRGHPIAGSAREFQQAPLQFLLRITREYGDIVRYRVAWQPVYLVNHPDYIKRVLIDNNRNYVGFNMDSVVSCVFGKSLFMNEGDSWRRQRRLMQPAFHQERIKAAGELIAGVALELVERWQRCAERGEVLEMNQEMMRLTLRIVMQALFGADISDEAHAVTQAVMTILDYFAYHIRKMPIPPPLFLPSVRNRQFKAALHTLERTVYHTIATRRSRNEETSDLLSLLMLARDEETGEGMSDRQLRDEVTAMLFMAHESTANALTWTWYLLSQHPQAERRLHAELAAVLGGHPPTIENLPDLPYTRMVFEEALRMYPPPIMLARRALADDEIGSYRITAKAGVVLSPYLIHHHPGVWENPEQFDPERFKPERAARRPRCAYIPFGAGPRQCIGSSFAMTAAQIVLATIAQHYRLHLMPGHPVEPDTVSTLHPRYGVRMILERR